MKKQIFPLVCLIFFALLSCVPQKKYIEMEESRNYFQDAYTNLKSIKEEKEALEREQKYTEAQLREAMTALERAKVDLERMQSAAGDVEKRYNELLEQNKEILNASSTEKASLENQLALQAAKLDEKQRKLSALDYTLQEREQNVQNLQENLEAREQRINELESAMASKEAQMSALRSNINNALRGFTANDLTVTERDGKIYVSLSQNLLFDVGSDKINFKGKNAIKQLSEALGQTDIDIMVLGHTDNTGDPSFNWDLSVKRATSVVKEMVKSQLDPARITAAGRAFYDPLAPNDTEAGKAQNRRTEIILSPKLEELYNILEN